MGYYYWVLGLYCIFKITWLLNKIVFIVSELNYVNISHEDVDNVTGNCKGGWDVARFSKSISCRHWDILCISMSLKYLKY